MMTTNYQIFMALYKKFDGRQLFRLRRGCVVVSNRCGRLVFAIWGIFVATDLVRGQDQSSAGSGDTISSGGVQTIGPFTPQVFSGDLRRGLRDENRISGGQRKIIPKRTYNVPSAVDPVSEGSAMRDPILGRQLQADRRGPSNRFSPPDLNFAGQADTNVVPPDTIGEVGAVHYIQMVNAGGGSVFNIYEKSSGVKIAGPIATDSLAPSGDCADGGGDPIVVYDHLADRWLLSEFSDSADALCVYISRTGDPVSGGWFTYCFATPEFPDYPKFAVWPDAYYVTTNETDPAVYALDRNAMLNGDAAVMQRFTAPPLTGFGFQALTPGDLDGATSPPIGSPAYFIRHRDDEIHNNPGNNPTQDFLEVWELHIDFVNDTNSMFTGPITIPIAEFDSNLCGTTSNECFRQPNTTQRLDPVREVVMWRLQYRSFGSYETLLGNFVTDVDGTDHGGIRWFELRKSGAGQWTVFQEGTYAPDAHNRWMGSIAMDGAGNIALGYSISSSSVFPGIRYTGRMATDSPGIMTQAEVVVIGGSGSQKFSDRWGDYSSMNVDPVDDRTFWYTNAYIVADDLWATQIARFSFADEPDFILSGTNLVQRIVGSGSLHEVTVTVVSQSGFSNPVTLSFESLPTGLNASFSENPVTPSGTSTVALSVDPTISPGLYTVIIKGSAAGATDKKIVLTVRVFENGQAICAMPAISIPDDDVAGVDDIMLLGFGSVIEDLDVSLKIDHTFVGDLIVMLEHVETGTKAVIIDRPGAPALTNGCNENDIDVTLADEASSPVEDACDSVPPAIAGMLTPNEPLSVFDGEPLTGTWILTVSDAVFGDTGQLVEWCLIPTVTFDSLPPEISDCGPGRTVTLDAACRATVPDLTAEVMATDNLDTNINIFTQSPGADSMLMAIGTFSVDIVVSDQAGNTSRCTTMITTIDNSSPEITQCPQNRTLTLTGDCQATIPDLNLVTMATDNCDTNVEISMDPQGTEILSFGEIRVVILTVSDDAGNTSSCSVTVDADGWKENISFGRGWNVISFPGVPVQDISLQNPEGAIWAWDGISFSAVDGNRIIGKTGYLVYFAAEQPSRTFCGSFPADPKTFLSAGWNFVGVCQSIDNPQNNPLISVPVWQWEGDQFNSVSDALLPFFGYWIFSESTTLIP